MGTRASKKRKLEDTDLMPTQVINSVTTKRKTVDGEGNIEAIPKVKYNEKRVGQVIDYLEKLRDDKHPVKEQLKVTKKNRIPLTKNATVEMQKLVVFLRYGSYTEIGPKRMTWRRISEITGVNKVTACLICKRWRLNGFRVIKKKVGNRHRAKWQTPEVISFLTKQQTLIAWAQYSLRQRVILIEQQLGVKISYNTLAEFYKKQKVRYVKPQYAYCRKMLRRKEIGDE